VPVMPASEGIDRCWPESYRLMAWQQPALLATDPSTFAFQGHISF